MAMTKWLLSLLFLGHARLAFAFNVARNYTILELSYQSKHIPFSDWISLLTLCLAPFIAHIVSGAPEPSYLSERHPRWHDRVCQYNPTTILWRYIAITDRRIRARAWNAADMAASNALFWTVRGWDGSEEMVSRSRAYCTKLPDNSKVKVFSGSSAKTFIITLQGVQALYSLLSGIPGTGFIVALDSIFYPLAIFGLLRLCAALWLTEDYSYVGRDFIISAAPTEPASQKTPFMEAQTIDSMGHFDHLDIPTERFRPMDSWSDRLYRAVYELPIIGLWILCFLYMVRRSTITLTAFLLGLFYLFLLTACIIIYTYYFVWHLSTTTIIPCIGLTWYKIYTGILFVLMIVLIVVAALGTRRTPCGKYTTWPKALATDAVICPGVYSNSTVT